jgi:CBS domain containing-hemolysin-like protein
MTGGRRFTGRLFGSRDELRQVMQESSQSLDREELAMVNRVLDLQNMTAGEAMVPLDQVTCVNADAPVGDFFRLCLEAGHERLPVREAGSSRIAGIVSLGRTLYRPGVEPHQRVEEFLQPAVYLAENVRLEEALARLQNAGQRLAIVLDRDRREVGILTLGDILKRLFGEVAL